MILTEGGGERILLILRKLNIKQLNTNSDREYNK